jgi:hypothetical protein
MADDRADRLCGGPRLPSRREIEFQVIGRYIDVVVGRVLDLRHD